MTNRSTSNSAISQPRARFRSSLSFAAPLCELRKQKGHEQIYNSSAAYRFEVPDPNDRQKRRNFKSAALDLPRRQRSDLLAPLAHFGTELAVDGLGKVLRPAVHIGHAELNCPG